MEYEDLASEGGRMMKRSAFARSAEGFRGGVEALLAEADHQGLDVLDIAAAAAANVERARKAAEGT